MSTENGMPANQTIVPTMWKFSQNQPIKIKPLDGWSGLVLARADYGDHQKYLVLWWLNSVRHEEWLHEYELEAA